MSDQESRIITTFRERLALEEALRGLSQAGTLFELEHAAARLAGEHGDALIAPMLSLLDSPDPRLRGGLGTLARILGRGKLESPLRRLAYDRSQPDQARLSAITILERYLHVLPDEAMYAGMGDPQSIALESLQGVLADMDAEPMILLEYFEQLAREPEDVRLTMARSARRLDGAQAVPLLHMFAQEPFLPAAEEALHILGTIADPAAATTLRVLSVTGAPSVRPLAARSLQKLQMRGVATPAATAPPPGYRCLATPIDATGHQVLWFAGPQPGGSGYQVLQVALGGQAGLLAAGGGRNIPADELSEVLPEGQLVSLDDSPPLQGGPQIEAPYDYGRRGVLAALERNWQAKTAPPLAYRLLNPMLWQWTLPEAGRELPPPAPLAVEETLALLQHPAMRGWFLLFPRMAELARDFLSGARDVSGDRVNAAALAVLRQELVRDAGFVEPLADNLLAMQEWLILAGEGEAAGLAAAAAHSLRQSPESNPFLTRLAEIGVRVAMILVARGE